MDGLLCNPSVLSFFKPPRSGERVQGTMFPAGVWGLESRARCAGFSVTEIGNRKERLRVREAGASAAGRGQRPHASFPDQSPITPPRWIASQSIPLPPSSNRREAEKGCREQVPCWGMGQSPIVPHRPSRPSPPSLDAYLSPFHHRCTRSARKRIKLPVRHVLDSVVRLHRTRCRRSRRRYAVAMRRRHAPA